MIRGRVRSTLRTAATRTAAATRWLRALGHDPDRLRRWGFVAALLLLAWVTLYLISVQRPFAAFAFVIPGIALVVLVLREWRHWVFAASAGLLALWVPAVDALAAAVGAFAFLAIVDSLVSVALLGTAIALAGSFMGLVVYPEQPTPGAFIALALGGAVAIVLRTLGRTRELTEETRVLLRRTRVTEEQARWLEQRTSLARELHDVVGHHVTAMVVQAEAGQVGDPVAALREIGTLGRTALGELDALVVHLRDPDAELAVSAPPRLSDIDELLAAPLRHQGVIVTVRVDPEPGLDEIGVLTVYRIAQEALTNVARHAQASAASVEVRRLSDHVRLRITDDGVGPPDAPERGSGLLGIQERVAARGGVWELGERLGGGTIVDVLLPVTSS